MKKVVNYVKAHKTEIIVDAALFTAAAVALNLAIQQTKKKAVSDYIESTDPNDLTDPSDFDN